MFLTLLVLYCFHYIILKKNLNSGNSPFSISSPSALENQNSSQEKHGYADIKP